MNFQTVQIPLATGYSQRSDVRANNPPSLDICIDGQFDELGGIQTRKPYSALGMTDIFGAAVVNPRRTTTYGNELVMFTRDAIYTRLSNTSNWIKRADHPAIAHDENIVLASNNDQMYGDRAELNGVVLYAWVEQGPAAAAVSIAAIDKASGTKILGPIVLTNNTRPRLVVNAVANRIYLFTYNGATGSILTARIIDVSSVSAIVTAIAAPYTISTSSNGQYDVVLVPTSATTSDVYGVSGRGTTTSYDGFIIQSSGAVFTFNKTRTADGPLAISPSTYATGQVCVVYSSGTAVKADILNFSFADVSVANAISTEYVNPVQLSTSWTGTGYALWISMNTLLGTRCGAISSAGAVTAPVMVAAWCDVASRAFASPVWADGYSYCWVLSCPFGTGTGYLQGMYALLRSDGLLVAVSRTGNAYQTPAAGWGAAVQATSNVNEVAWLCTYLRDVEAVTISGTASRSLRDMVVRFDTVEARRTVKFGSALYITGSLPLQYDGATVVETGHVVAPCVQPQVDFGAGGSLSAGLYAYKSTTRWANSKGEVDRSTSLGVASINVAASHITSDNFSTPEQWLTRKVNRTHETWRTKVNPGFDDPFYLVSSQSVGNATNPNRYVSESKAGTTQANAFLTTMSDALADTVIVNNEEHPETGDELAALPPPPHTIATATASRAFIAAVAGSPNQVWYSKYREDGKTVGFNDALTIDVPAAGGVITSLAVLNNNLVVFRTNAIYVYSGDGFGNTGDGSNYTLTDTVTIDVGAINRESTTVIDEGIMFKSQKGWHLLDRSLSVHYIGGAVDDYDAETVYSTNVMPAQHQTRVLTSGRMLVFDHVANAWSEWSIHDGIASTVWNGAHVYISSSNGMMQQRSDYAGINYGLDIETAWIKPNDLQGMGKIRKILMLGEYRGVHKLRIRVARDYEYASPGVPVYFDDVLWAPAPATIGSTEQVKHGPRWQRCEAIKIRFTAVGLDGVSAPTAEALKVTGLAMRIGVYDNVNQRLTAAQKD